MRHPRSMAKLLCPMIAASGIELSDAIAWERLAKAQIPTRLQGLELAPSGSPVTRR
jgi:hypothetical protein